MLLRPITFGFIGFWVAVGRMASIGRKRCLHPGLPTEESGHRDAEDGLILRQSLINAAMIVPALLPECRFTIYRPESRPRSVRAPADGSALAQHKGV